MEEYAWVKHQYFTLKSHPGSIGFVIGPNKKYKLSYYVKVSYPGLRGAYYETIGEDNMSPLPWTIQVVLAIVNLLWVDFPFRKDLVTSIELHEDNPPHKPRDAEG